MAELAERLGFNLANTLSGDVEFLADLLQRTGSAVVEAEAELLRRRVADVEGHCGDDAQHHPLPDVVAN